MANHYFVFHPGRNPKYEENLYPLERKGYSLKIAKDYARISSAHGDATDVYRGKPTLTKNKRKVKTGKLVRRYEQGKRVFPFVPEDLVHPVKLTKAEVPKTMKQYARGMKMAANPAAVGMPQPTKTLQVAVYRSGSDWVGQLESKRKDMMYREMLSRSGKADAFDDVALITFSRKPRLSAAQNRRLASKGDAVVRMQTKRVEELIDSTWNVDVFPWASNPRRGGDRAEALKPYRSELVDAMAKYAWKNGLMEAVEQVQAENDMRYPGLVSDLEDDWKRAPDVKKEMRMFLKSFEEHNDGKWYDVVAAQTDADEGDIDTLGYYLYMQSMGHGVAWSDSREGELDTPDCELYDTYVLTEQVVDDAVDLIEADEE